ncbi:diguanylate cyclase (GGDEF)-like protein [Anaerotaenia torta]|uniref:histidine kinase N-terminal 7TM domain-containing diguanylate cyclase n=1 Tax=Anaerotaenia torta TaxID=433293 RepID=UPI003D20E423
MPNIFVLAIMLSVAVTAMLMVYAIVKHTVEKSFFLILLSIANLFFVFGNLLEITAGTLETAFYGVRVQYMGAPFIMPLTYLFYREFYGKKRFTPLQHTLLFVIPVLSMLALQAFPLVRLHYPEIWYSTNGYIASVQHTDGITYYLGTALNYICILLSLRLIIGRIRHGGKQQRRQSLVLLTGWVLPLAANASFVFLGGDGSYDLTPIAYVTSMAVLLYAALAHNLLDILPLARAQVMDELEDAFIVCDDDFHFLDANLSARRLFPELSAMSSGESIERIRDFKREGELRIRANGEEQHYKITQNPILHGTKDSGVCVVFRNVTVENRLLESLQRQATMDALTGLYNRGTFFGLAEEALEKGKAQGMDFALLMIDLDRFKQVNDTYGHPCGDAVLKAVAAAARNHFYQDDIVGRYGGEEFAVLLENISGEQAAGTAEEFRKTVGGMIIRCHEQRVGVTVSIGIACCTSDDGQTLEGMLAQADKALYLSKSRGRNQISLYDGKDTSL